LARAQWLESRQAELLPVEYFHLVFTLPEPIAQLAFYNQHVLYAMLFRAASETLLTLGADPKHLGAQLGFFAILHTWGQNLLFHPHLHAVVPAGGLSPDQERFVLCRQRRFFLPVKLLSRLFRRLFLEALEEAFYQKRLQFPGSVEPLRDAGLFHHYLYAMEKLAWVVHAQPPFGGPERVLRYLGRYTHRVAISNQRLLALPDGQVSFQWKDYREPDKAQQSKALTLSAQEFIRRFLLHSLPPGFQRIRYFGFLPIASGKQSSLSAANGCRESAALRFRRPPLANSFPAPSRSRSSPVVPNAKSATCCAFCFCPLIAGPLSRHSIPHEPSLRPPTRWPTRPCSRPPPPRVCLFSRWQPLVASFLRSFSPPRHSRLRSHPLRAPPASPLIGIQNP